MHLVQLLHCTQKSDRWFSERQCEKAEIIDPFDWAMQARRGMANFDFQEKVSVYQKSINRGLSPISVPIIVSYCIVIVAPGGGQWGLLRGRDGGVIRAAGGVQWGGYLGQGG